jgi:hypothetical protein
MDAIALGLDYSAARISGASIRAAGFRFVNRYLWFMGQGHAYLNAEEYRDLTANGVEVHAVYEEDSGDPAGGWPAGIRMARQAVESAIKVGLPAGTTIYMCADAWLSRHGITVATAMSFLDGARSVLSAAGYLTGAYGFADFIYAAQDGGHADRFWLCGDKSGVRPGIHHYQRNYRTNPNGPDIVSGVAVDVNEQYLPMGADDMSAEGEKQILKVLGDAYENTPDGERTIGTRVKDMDKRLGYVEKALGDAYDSATDITIGDRVKNIEEKVDQLATSGVPVSMVVSAEDKADIARLVVAELKKEGN